MIARILIAVLILSFPALARAATPVLSVDFAHDGAPSHAAKLGSFDGPLPDGCEPDYPAWNKSVAKSETLAEGAKAFTRFDVSSVDQAVYLRLPNASISLPGYYLVETEYRTNGIALNVHLRQLPAPYHSFWSKDLPDTRGKWSLDRSLILIDKTPRPSDGQAPWDTSNLRLYLSLYRGVADIASIRLTALTADEIGDPSAGWISRPKSALPNYFRNSRFPLGLPEGWTVDRENTDGSVDADSSVPGPSGCPSLRIASPTGIRVLSEPFQTATTGTEHTVSFACQGDGQWNARLVTRTLMRTVVSSGPRVAFTPSATWERQQLSFVPPSLGQAFAVEFSGKGVLRIDSLCANAGSGDGRFAPPAACELGLAPGDTSLARTRIQFADEPATVRWCASGAYEGAAITLTVVDVWGRRSALPAINLPARSAGPTFGVANFGARIGKQLGEFRIEGWIEKDGNRISPCNEIVVARVRRPVYWGKDAPNSPFGDHFLPQERVVATMKAAGMNWARFNDAGMECTCWGFLEPEKGQWSFRDDRIQTYRKAHIKILGQLGTAPKWASYYAGERLPGYLDLCAQPRSLDDFANYVRVVVGRYKGVIDDYEIGNEPWGAMFWHKSVDPTTGKPDAGTTPAADYSAYSKVAYAAAKQADPAATIVGVNAAPWTDWAREVAATGGYDACDMASYHFYTPDLSGYPDSAASKAYGLIVKNLPSPLAKPIVMSEGSATRDGSVPDTWIGKDDASGLANYSLPWKSNDDPIAIADSPCRFLLDHLSNGVRRVFFYSDHCWSNLLASPTFPVLLGADGYPLPSLASFSNFAWLLEDRKYVSRKELANGVWAYCFEGRGKTVAVISGLKAKVLRFKPSRKIEFLDLFGNTLDDPRYDGVVLYAVGGLAPTDMISQLAAGTTAVSAR